MSLESDLAALASLESLQRLARGNPEIRGGQGLAITVDDWWLFGNSLEVS